MTAESEKTKRATPPKGGRKGGMRFPQLNLKQALAYSEKLVAKTHTGPLPAERILPGVFGTAGPRGQVRASALKQFGLLQGPINAYEATDLAKKIVAAPPEEQPPLLQQAFLGPKLFKDIFETYKSDTVQKAKIRQQALNLGVHPENADEAVELFMDSAVTAALAIRNGDNVTLSQTSPNGAGPAESIEGAAEEETEQAVHDDNQPGEQDSTKTSIMGRNQGEQKRAATGQKAAVNVTLNVDSSSDPEKLEKQLRLLQKFGVI